MPRLGPPFELVLPGVEELPLQIQLAGQSPNVFAGLHPFDDLPFELHGVPTPLCHLCHFGLHSMQSAFIRRVSLLGFTPWLVSAVDAFALTGVGFLEVLVEDFALFLVYFFGVGAWKAIKDFFDGDPDHGPCGLLFAPVED